MSLKHEMGFALVEIMVVVSVIMVGFIGVLLLLEQTIKLRGWNENYLVASELAGEGIELTRMMRNRNWLSGDVFDSGINAINSPFFGESNSLANDTKIFTIDERVRDNPADGLIQLFSNNGGDNLDSLLLNDQRVKLFLDSFISEGIVKQRFHNNVADQPVSRFSRAVKTIYYDNGTANDYTDDYLYVISKVYWQDRNKDYFYTLAAYLYDYDWYY